MKKIMPVVGSVKCGVDFQACTLIPRSNPIFFLVPINQKHFSRGEVHNIDFIFRSPLFSFAFCLFEAVFRGVRSPVKGLTYFVGIEIDGSRGTK